MPVNRNALIRYKTIDKCLQNRYRQWTLEDLIDACSDALYEYEGIDKGVSKRTVQADIQMMRSDKLGYNAPIVVTDKKYYAYEEPDYSITNIPITDQDLGKLNEAVDFLKQFKGFSHFKELDSMVQKLEDHVYSQKNHQKPVIDFEKNENLKGLEFLDILYQTIIHKKAIEITYQSFTARKPNSFTFHPYLLKEFKNRWFVMGARKKDENISNLALDRIIKLTPLDKEVRILQNFDPETYYKNTIGVSVNTGEAPEDVKLYVTHKHAPYILTKPLHWSQQEIDRDNFGVTISLKVQHNHELEKEILGFGDGIRVIQPLRLKRAIKTRIAGAMDLYDTDLSQSGISNSERKLKYKGSSVINHVYIRKASSHMSKMIDAYIEESGEDKKAIRELLKKVPQLKEILFNKNLKSIIKAIDKKAYLVKSMYFDKPIDDNWYVTWHQDATINVKKKIKTEGFTGWTKKKGVISVRPPEDIMKNIFTLRIHLTETDHTNGALKVLHGSHNKLMTDEEITLITQNSVPTICDVGQGGVHLMKPLILHKSDKSKNNRKRRVIHLEFANINLPNGLEWAEKERVM